MTQRAAATARRLWRAALVAAGVALTGIGWAGYRAADAQLGWAALWSLCASAPVLLPV